MLPWVTVIMVAFLITTSWWAAGVDCANAAAARIVVSKTHRSASLFAGISRIVLNSRKVRLQRTPDCRSLGEKGQREMQ